MHVLGKNLCIWQHLFIDNRVIPMMLSLLVIVVSLLASATAFRAPKSPVAAGIQLRMSFEDAVGAQPPLGKCATLSGIIRLE